MQYKPRLSGQRSRVLTCCRHLGLGSYGEWPEEQRLQFLTQELEVGPATPAAAAAAAAACCHSSMKRCLPAAWQHCLQLLGLQLQAGWGWHGGRTCTSDRLRLYSHGRPVCTSLQGVRPPPRPPSSHPRGTLMPPSPCTPLSHRRRAAARSSRPPCPSRLMPRKSWTHSSKPPLQLALVTVAVAAAQFPLVTGTAVAAPLFPAAKGAHAQPACP